MKAACALAMCGVVPALAASTNKAQWITQASDYILTDMPRVDSFMWFNNYKPAMSEPDWRIVPDSPDIPDPAVVAAYNAAWTGMARGVYIDGAPPDLTKTNYFESFVGHHDRIGWFESFSSPFPLASVQAVAARGSTPYIVWQPYDDNIGATARGTKSLLPYINTNQYYAYVRNWALAAAAYNKPIDISLGHEMNGNWFSWAYLPDDFYNSPSQITNPNLVGHNGNTPAAFVSAFKYVVDIFNAAGATKVNFVWNVNADFIDTFTIAFPGEAYVDRLGMNGFNWGRNWPVDPNNPNWDDWREASQIFDNWGGFSTYNTLAGLGSGTLPIILGETGTNTPEPATLGFLALGALALMRRRRA